ncbi:MAG TPA: head-tail adaptor, partial [Porticoccaceae bacterium]|nr:head-tail adaptor [Porticoccaceae bacterium]
MRAGRLRDNVSIESIGSARDQFGQVIESWSEDTTRRCSIEPI